MLTRAGPNGIRSVNCLMYVPGPRGRRGYGPMYAFPDGTEYRQTGSLQCHPVADFTNMV